jgi:hypothetical protein
MKKTKKCSRCKKRKSINCFNKNIRLPDGFASACKVCLNQRRRKNYQDFKQDFIEKKRKYREQNREKIREQDRVLRKKHKKRYNKRRNEIRRKRKQTDIGFRVLENTRRRLNEILRTYKTNKTLELLGCSVQKLKSHLEKQFLDGMNWDNYGFYGWHIDHIKPCSSFDFSDPEQQKICFHYSNLQPLWAKDNLCKGSKLFYKIK